MVELVLIVLLVMAAFNSGREVITAWLFAIGLTSYMITGVIFEFTGYSYYLASAVSCLIAIIYLTHSKIKDELHIDLSILFVIGIGINCLGWVAYELYLGPFCYNVAFSALYIGLIIRLMTGKHRDGIGRNVTYSDRINAFFSILAQCCWDDQAGKK